jgi:hypothetical protein
VSPGETQRSGIPIGLACSLVAHALVVVVALVWPSSHVPAPDLAPGAIDIVTVDPPPRSPLKTATPGEVGPTIDPAPGRTGKRAAPIRRAESTVDPYAELVVSFDDGTSLASGGNIVGVGPGQGLFGAGFDGVGDGGGVANMPIARASLARDPSPRADYTRSNAKYPELYAGETIVVDLELDATGHVTHETLVKGLGSMDIEDDVMRAIRRFEFWPALDSDGHAIPSHYHWLWVMTAQR